VSPDSMHHFSVVFVRLFTAALVDRASHSVPTRRSSDLPPVQSRPGADEERAREAGAGRAGEACGEGREGLRNLLGDLWRDPQGRSEEHTSELQSRFDLVCRLLLDKKNYDNVCETRHARI